MEFWITRFYNLSVHGLLIKNIIIVMFCYFNLFIYTFI